MTLFTRLVTICFFMVIIIPVYSQQNGDFRSRATGNWGDYTTWQVYNGTTWIDATSGQTPGGTSEADAQNVYIEAGHTVTLESDHSCKDIHLNTTADVVRINTQNNSLNVWGKMRFYIGTAPGSSGNTTASISSSGITGWITTGANGYIRFRGTANRIVMVQGEVNANNSNSGWNMDFAFDPGFTGEINDRIRATNITVTSGEIFMNNASAELRVGTNSGTSDVTPNGVFILKSGATVRGGAGIFKKANVAAQTITVESGATLVITRSSYVLAAATLDLSGTVILQQTITFPTEAARTGAVPVNTFTNLTIEGSGTKTLQNSITVTGKLQMGGTATLSTGSFTLSYGSSGELEYRGSAAQTTTGAEFPVTSGPNKLTINNPNGVTLHQARTVQGQLTLTDGLLFLGNNHLTLGAGSPAVAGAPSATAMVVTSGAGELRKIFSVPGSFFYPVGDTAGTDEYSYAQITINSANTLDATTYFGVRTVDASHPADANVAVHNISRYWGLSTNMVNVNHSSVFQYLAEDIKGTESSINTYIYNNETPLATGTLINSVNTVLHRIVINNQTATGFVTGSNLCKVGNNTIGSPTNLEYCETGSPATFNASPATVTSGSPVYQWQMKTNNGNWGDITANGQNEDYIEPNTLGTGSYYYRRIVSDPAYCTASDKDTSNLMTVIVSTSISGNTIGNDQTVGTGGDPAALNPSSSLAGGTGTYTYQWKSTTTSGTSYTDISGGTAASYDPANGIGQTTYFIREVASGGCTSTSNEVSIITCDVTNNTLTGPATTGYCAPATPELFDGSAASVSAGTISYQWQRAVNGSTWYDVSSNGQGEDYTETSSLSEGTYAYRRVGSCGLSSSVASNSITITVLPAISGNIIGNNQTITPGGDPSLLDETGSLSGGNGTYSYQWSSSTTQGTGYTDIDGETNSSCDPAAGLTESTYFIRKVTSGVCTSTSNEVTLSVGPTGVYASYVPGVAIYPNPVVNKMTLDLDLSVYKNIRIILTTGTGEVVYQDELASNGISNVDLSEYPSGIYFAQIILDGQRAGAYKIIKQ